MIVTGRLRQRSYETREGERRTVYEVEADDIGPSLRYAIARPVKTTRRQPQHPAGDQWSTVGGAAGAAGAAAGPAGDEPPF